MTFDQEDAWATPWQTSTVVLPAGASEGTLIFEVADASDSIYDTVVVVDDIRLTP